ncbi:MAG: hypothetical protein QM778_34250 [Myxococcales bacterium]
MLNAYAWFRSACLATCVLGLGACAQPPRGPAGDGSDLSSSEGDGDGDGDGDSSDGPSSSGDGDGDGDYWHSGDGDGDTSGEFGSVDGGAGGNPLGGLGGLFGGGGASDAGTQPTGDAGDCVSSPRVCWDVFDCYIFHPGDLGCGYTRCDGFVCKP